MVRITSKQTVLLALAVVLLVGGASIGVWNYQSIQNCQDEFPPGPDTHADCVDAVSRFFSFSSILSVAMGLIIIGGIFYKSDIR